MDLIILILGLSFIASVENYRIKRIIGSQINSIENVPYMLSMRLNDKHICGATIISEEWSLTAAHCCLGIKTLSMRSRITNLNETATVHNVTEIIRHQKYTRLDDDFDICAVKVDPPFEMLPVKLPEPDQPVNLASGLISGWGPEKKDTNKLSSTLRSGNVTRVDLEVCKNLLRDSYTVHDTNTCYGNGTTDACSGDSGGPLVNDDGYLIGITSFGVECGSQSVPGVYVDVMQFLWWIKNITTLV